MYKTGDTILYNTKFVWKYPITWLSALIRLFTSYKYNHVAVIVSNWDKLMINESLAKGVISRPLDQVLNRKNSEYIILRPLFNFPEKDFAERANSKIGVKYDYINLIFEQVHYRIWKRWLGRDKDTEEKRMICSEYVAYCFNKFTDGFEENWKWSAKEFGKSNKFKVINHNGIELYN